jgi:gamma-glutamyltranspeptidase/glutathione hydrolase
MTRRIYLLLALAFTLPSLSLQAGSAPVRARLGMVVSQSDIASEVGFQVIRDGGNAVDAAVATALALAVTHPTAGNIGGGGFIVYRSAAGAATAYDFREAAPAGSNPEMWLKDGKYDADLHHNSHRSVGVPGTVAGLELAREKYGTQTRQTLIAPAIRLAEKGFVLNAGDVALFTEGGAELANDAASAAIFLPEDARCR